MRRGVVIAFAILGLTACGQKESQTAAGGAATGATTESAAPAGEAAKPDVAAAANPDENTCLDLVATERYADAVPACERAISANSEKAKAALATAQAKIAENAANAAQGAADAAKDAAGEAQDAADSAKGAVPKTY